MIVGSGLLAQAFSKKFETNKEVCVYAAGVSNSKCTDKNEFLRDEKRLCETLELQKNIKTFIYFGTCSVYSIAEKETPYTIHKLKMEEIVRAHPNYFIFRLPQVVGKAKENSTLINFLYQKISSGQTFELWDFAYRNIIDVDDIVSIASEIIKEPKLSRKIINIANPRNISVRNLVVILEQLLGIDAKKVIVSKGENYFIDTSLITDFTTKLDIDFTNQYEQKVLEKYYRII